MRCILRQREFRADEWRYAGEEPGAAAVILTLADLRRAAGDFSPARLGVRLSPGDAVEDLAPFLPRLQLIAVEFPNPGDGRGYSQARMLRERLNFSGELRAVGAGVRQDLLFFMARCGCNAFELAAGEDSEAALRALARYQVAYQPADPQVVLRAQRFARASAAAE